MDTGDGPVGNSCGLDFTEDRRTAMVDPTRRIGLVALLGLTIVCGCKSSSAENTYPKDPLLLSKKPMDGKAGPPVAGPGPALVASAEPVAPTAPTTALASLRKP